MIRKVGLRFGDGLSGEDQSYFITLRWNLRVIDSRKLEVVSRLRM